MKKVTKCRTFNFNKIKERDNFVCQKCGRSCDEVPLEVHHKKAFSSGGDNSHENLILLCKFCHKKAPDNSTEDFDDFLVPPLPIQFDLTYVILQDFYNKIINDVRKCFNLKQDFSYDDGFLSFNISKPDKCSKKNFVKLFNPYYADFYTDNLVQIFNFSKDKCRGYNLWKESLMNKKVKK